MEMITILGIALLAGFLMNLMPCVLPVIGLKLRTLGQPGQKWPYVTGVLVSFMALATCSLLLGTGISQMGFGIYRATLVVVCFLMAAHLLNMWRMPSFGYSGNLGPFGTGLLTVALGSSCAVPFLAPAMAYTLTCGVIETYLVFLALGVGFCSPFLLPIPMTHFQKDIGGVWFERLCGLALGAVAVWIALTLRTDYLSATMLITGGALLVLSAREWSIRVSRVGFVPLFLGLNLLLIACWYVPPVDDDDAAVTQTWPTSGPRAIFVTADWCLNCKVVKPMLSDITVIKELEYAGIDGFTIVDYTDRPDNVKSELFDKYMLSGDVPVLIIITDKGRKIILSGMWTKYILLKSLRRNEIFPEKSLGFSSDSY